MQKERLIRRRNPNWLDLSIAATRTGAMPPILPQRRELPATTSRVQN